MKISVVTVCYNMEAYIEETILSVLSQQYDNLEYIIIDGGSTDGTMSVVNKYRDRLAVVISEPDHGMYDALKKGFSHATGDILAWINADDRYLPWTLATVNRVFSTCPEIQWLGGRYAFVNEDGMFSQIFGKTSLRRQGDIANGWCREGVLGPLQQESMFWRRELYFESGGLDTRFRYAGDFELWMRFAQHAPLVKIDLPLSAFRRRAASLSNSGHDKYTQEVEQCIADKGKYPNLIWRLCAGSSILVQILRKLRLCHGRILYYDITSQQLKSKVIWGSASNHTLNSLLLYR